MRKLILVSAFVLASAVANAGEISKLVLAANDAPAAAATATPTTATQTADTAKPQASRKQASRSRKTQRETDEQKARRIAAKYGVSW